MAVRFDAAADRLSYSAVAPPAAFTITCWAYLSVDRNAVSVIGRVWVSAPSQVATWRTAADGTSGPQYFSDTGTISNTTNFVVGEWRKIAITRTGSSGQSLVATPAGPTEVDAGTVDTAIPVGLTLAGRHSGSANDPWNGRLAYVRIWSAVLSQSEIEAEWASAIPVRSSDLWANWPLSTATDLTDTVAGRVLTTVAGVALTTEDGPPLATVHDKTGGAAAGGAGIGAAEVVSPAAHAKAGGAATSGAGSGSRQVSSLVAHVRTGGAVATAAGSGQDVVAHLSAIRTRLHAGTPVAVGRFYAGAGVVA